jgi:hypothetical protein
MQTQIYVDIKEHLLSSYNGVRYFSAASHCRQKAGLMTADRAEADTGGPRELLKGVRGPHTGKTETRCH